MKYVIFCLFCLVFIGCSSDQDKEIHEAEKKRAEQNVFAIASDSSWYPIELYGKEKYVSAFMDDFCSELAKIEKIQFSLFPATYSDMFDQLNRGTYEGVISSMVPSDSNKETYLFSDPIIYLGPVLVVPKSSKANSVGDMQGLILLVPNDEELIIEISKSPSIIIKTYDNMGDALAQVVARKADGALIENLAASTYTHGIYREQLRVATAPLDNTALRLVAPASHPRGKELVNYFNEGLRILRENGVYYYLKRKWSLKDDFE